ncbi:HYR domain-containing protein, partial [Cryomorphaceae bacterium 1068]|nr:HYR domain-containing protein [Cryomorphaceae bacterium 1068]
QILLVRDATGNEATCTAQVTVEDNIAPEALCVGSLEVQLDAFGNANITANDIDAGSNDACGIASLSIDQTSFNCNDIAAPSGPALIITGVLDAGLSGGLPKAIELYVVQDISDLGIYAIGSANNGGGSDGEEFFLSGSASAGDYIYIASEALQFDNFFGFSPDFTTSSAEINGDDAVELFENGSVIDVFGDINTDGTGEAWEYLDGWAYRVSETGPDGTTFVLGNWTYSGINVLDGESGNATASTPFPLGTYAPAAAAANTVTLTVTDNNGNTSTCTSEISVVELSGPQALCNIFTIQLDENGMASIDVDDVDDGSFAACGIADRSIDVADFTCADSGPNDVVLTITDVNGVTSSCTAVVTVEDVTPPTAQCTNITVQLDASGNAAITASDIDNGSFDNCEIDTRSIDISSFSCSDVGNPVTVTLTVTDVNGLVSTCQSTVTVEDNVAPEAICTDDLEVILDANGQGTLTAAEVDNGSNDACGIASISIDKTDFDCTDLSMEGSAPTFALIITGVIDGPLSGGTPKAIELYAAQDIVDLSIYGIGSANNGGGTDGEEFTLSGSATAGSYIYIASETTGFSNYFGFAPDFTDGSAGINGDDAIELFENGSVIDVFGDIDTDGTGEAWDYLDGWAYRNSDSEPSGSTFGLASWSFSGINALDGESDNASAAVPFPIGSYTVGSASTTEVTLTVTDNNGNISSCTAAVTVTDNLAPTAVCTTDAINVILDASGNGTLTAGEVDGGSTDNCGIVSTTVSPSTFTCAETGPQTVTLTVTDASGNEGTCTKVINVVDDIAPIAICQDLNVELDAMGSASITAAQIDNGSTDICGIASLSLDVTTFDCSNLGANTVTLTVTDNNGNSSICTAIVTVEDNMAPTITCPANITVSNDVGACGANVTWIVPTGSDNCSIASVVGDAASGDFFGIGTTTVSYTATDGSGLTADCSFTVTVEDTEAPDLSCIGNVAVTVNQVNGTYLASGGEFDPSFSDNCPGATLTHDAAAELSPQVGPNNESLDGWEFPIGTTTITFMAMDASGNIETCTFDITVESAVLSGEVTLNGACLPLDMTVSVYEAGTPNASPILVATYTDVEIAGDGTFSLAAMGLVPGSYDVYIKPENYLTKFAGNYTINASPTNITASSLVPGDISVNEDDVINGDDLSLILGAYNTEDGVDAGYDGNADLNCDGFVDALDLSLLIFFFLDGGDNPQL